MKEFIHKWSNWWILHPQRKQLDEAFEKELNELIELEVALRQLPVSRRSFTWWATDDLIDCLPQNRPLYKDSGLWQVRTDNMEDVFIQQNVNETLRCFIIRYLEWLDEFGQADEVYIDLSLRPMNGG